MELARLGVSMVPVVGPVADALDAASQGCASAAIMELGLAAMDVVSLGQTSTLRAATSGVRGLAKVARMRVVASKLRSVVKTAVKRKAGQKAKQFGAKAGFAAALTAAGRVALRRGGAREFAQTGSADQRLHAWMAMEVYCLPTSRRNTGSYRYVGGDNHRGAWHSPADGGHLIMAERGTKERVDLRPDVCLGSGFGTAAVSNRAQQCRAELLYKFRAFPSCRRVTLTGHSLGGSVACFLASSPPEGVPLTEVHVFNPGGLPDLTRSITCASSATKVHAHCILGDPISAAFLPGAQKHYARRRGYEDHLSHAMVHFLD